MTYVKVKNYEKYDKNKKNNDITKSQKLWQTWEVENYDMWLRYFHNNNKKGLGHKIEKKRKKRRKYETYDTGNIRKWWKILLDIHRERKPSYFMTILPSLSSSSTAALSCSWATTEGPSRPLRGGAIGAALITPSNEPTLGSKRTLPSLPTQAWKDRQNSSMKRARWNRVYNHGALTTGKKKKKKNGKELRDRSEKLPYFPTQAWIVWKWG